ncbi:MAG: outer membrane protein assembly factor BamA [Deltaproteobacteria bacterium]
MKTSPLIKLFKCFIFLLFAFLPAYSFAQAPDSANSGKTVTAIEIRGNKSISEATVVSKLKTKIGSPYQENIVSDDLKRLYLTGYFSDVKIDTEDYKEGVKIIITVKERPIIEKVTFSGSRRAISDAKLKETIKSKEGQYLDYPTLSEDVKAVKGLYEKKGYGKVDVTDTANVDEKTNKATVNFNINEGQRQRIRRIFIEGNLHYSDGKLLKVIKTRRAWLFNSGVLKEDVLQEDVDRLKTFYQNNGYIDAAASVQTSIDPNGKFIYVTFTIEEGKRYYVGSVDMKGYKDVSENDIRSKITRMVTGKVFSPEGLKKDVSDIQGLYFDKGYISAGVNATTALSREGLVDVMFTIVENEIAYVNKVKVRGNVKTKDVVIRREMRLKPGERFDGEKLRRSKERLQNLGFFDEVSYDIEDTAEPNKKDLIVDVKEAKTGMFSFGGGYSTVDKLVGFVEIEQKNFDWKNWPYFTGAGQDLKLRTSFGSVSKAFELSYTEPWLFDYPVSFGFDLYKRTHSRSSDTGYGYDEDVTGGDIRLGKELSEYVRGNFTYRYDTIKISNIDTPASQALLDEQGTNSISSTEYGLSYDTRDNVFNPTKGDFDTTSLQIAGGPFGGTKDFWKSFSRASHYFPLWHGSSLEARGRLGIGKAYGDSERIPIYERFFAGGAYTVRGYRERKVGPIDPFSGDPVGGESLLVGNLEYTYPVLDFFRVAAFYDIGNVWEKAGDIGNGGFKAGTGVGFRLKTPIGPIMLDYGIPLNKEPGSDKVGNGRFHFSMSQSF